MLSQSEKVTRLAGFAVLVLVFLLERSILADGVTVGDRASGAAP
jgi:hypothetical protein